MLTICNYSHTTTSIHKITVDLYLWYAHTLTDMPTRGSLHERGVAILVLVLYISTSIEQDLDHIFIASTASIGEGSVTNTRLGIDVGSVVDEELHDVSIATRGSLHKRGRVTYEGGRERGREKRGRGERWEEGEGERERKREIERERVREGERERERERERQYMYYMYIP